MARSRNTGVRIGPISLLTLISVLLLAVLSMLCITTTKAASAMTDRQVESVSQTYALDSCGQWALAVVDETLQSGGSAADAASAMLGRWDSIKQQAVSDVAAAGNLTLTANSSGDVLNFEISADSGKALNAQVRVSGTTYQIEKWQTATTLQMPEETLWSGASSTK